MKMFRVLFITVNESPYSGGSGIQMELLKRDLLSDGHFAMTLYRYDDLDQTSVIYRKKIKKDKFTLIEPFIQEPEIIESIVSKNSINIIYCHINALIYLPIIFKEKPIVIAYHGISGEIMPKVLTVLKKINVHAIVTISDKGKNFLLKSLGREFERRLWVILQSIDPRNENTDDINLIEQLPKHNKLIVALGSVRRYKGYEDFIDIIESLKTQIINVSGIIIGKIDSILLEEIAISKNLELKSTVEGFYAIGNTLFVGLTETPMNWLKITDVLLCVSKKYEASPGALKEAILSETKIFSYDVGFIGEMIPRKYHQNILVEKFNKDLMVQKVVEYLYNPEDYIEQIRDLKRFIKDKYSQKRRYEQNLDLFKKTLNVC